MIDYEKAYDEKKVKALRTHIVEECKAQGFTVYEFEQLVRDLELDYTFRREKVSEELF